MDRFIAPQENSEHAYRTNLKSNMDRFIVNSIKIAVATNRHLKSNMDRFIGRQTRTQERIF